MRNFSKENQRNQFMTQVPLRSCISQKRLSHYGHHSSNEYIRVGQYKYKEQDLLGKGFSSKVFKAVHFKNQGQTFAIKVIDLRKFKSSNLVMLENQIKVQKALSHPNIVKCYDVYKTQQFYYIVTQYCPHGDLMQLITQKRSIDQNRSLQIIKQVIEGYKYLIKRGVFHRDLKPANIFKSNTSWKIGDFGFSIFCKHEYILDSVNVGTPLYMPPQSLRSNKYSAKTDIFALGIILYEMLTGKTPWESRTQKQLLQKMESSKLKLPPKINNLQILIFLQKACEVDEFQRLTRDGIEKVFQEKAISNPQQNTNKKVSLARISKGTQSNKLISTKKGLSSSTQNSEIEENLSMDEIFKKNTSKLIEQLQFCRHIYYMIGNIEYFMLDNNRKQFFVMVLFKHILRYIKLIEDSKNNVFNLSHWQAYRHSSGYLNFHPQIKAYEKRYEKEYLQYLKNAEIPIIRSANRKFPQLSYTSSLSKNFYQSFKTYLLGVLRILNHEVMKKTKTASSSKYYQTVESLYTYYLSVEEKGIDENKKTIFYRNKILTQYSKSKLDHHEYQKLRDKIKTL